MRIPSKCRLFFFLFQPPVLFLPLPLVFANEHAASPLDRRAVYVNARVVRAYPRERPRQPTASAWAVPCRLGRASFWCRQACACRRGGPVCSLKNTHKSKQLPFASRTRTPTQAHHNRRVSTRFRRGVGQKSAALWCGAVRHGASGL